MEKLQFRIDTGNGSRELILDSKNFLYYAAQKLEKSLVPEEKVIEAAIDRPLGGVSLEDIPIDGKVAVIIDDATRPTPLPEDHSVSSAKGGKEKPKYYIYNSSRNAQASDGGRAG